jgi:FkbM family methyltransferase
VSGDRALLPRFLFRAVRARFRDQRAEIVALMRAIAPGEAAVDVGANKGSFLPWLSRAAGTEGRVYAFEPQPELAAYLERACRAAGLDHVEVAAVGVSDRAGTRVLRIPGEAGPSPGASLEAAVAERLPGRDVTVPVVALDERLRTERRRIAAVKIDVEGHELSVLRGASGILDRDAPVVVVEAEERHAGAENLAAVLAFFAERGFEGWFVRRGRLEPLAAFDPSVHQKRLAGRFWGDADYCNNFVLRKKRG